MNDHVTAPVAKASAALGAGAGTSVMAMNTAQVGSFLPVDLAGWLAAGASAMALLYSSCLMAEWAYKKWKRRKLPALAPDAETGPAPL